MKLLILSDSHREMEYMRDAVRRERPDAVIHLGDLVPDADRLAEEFPGLPVLSVRGNCDFSQPPRAEELLRTFEGVKIWPPLPRQADASAGGDGGAPERRGRAALRAYALPLLRIL